MAVRRRTNPASAVEAHPLTQLDFIHVTMEWDEETRTWGTYVRELNNASTFGDTQEEALNMTAELILGYIDVLIERGYEPPFSKKQLRQLREALGELA